MMRRKMLLPAHWRAGRDDKNRIVRAELVSVVTQQLAVLTGQIGKALKEMGFSGSRAGQVGADGRRGGTGRAGRFHAGRAGAACSAWAYPPQLPGMPEGAPRARALQRWRACAFMPPKTRSISARCAGGRATSYRGAAREGGSDRAGGAAVPGRSRRISEQAKACG